MEQVLPISLGSSLAREPSLPDSHTMGLWMNSTIPRLKSVVIEPIAT